MAQKMDECCKMKKNMFLPIREGIAEVLHELQQLRQDTEYTEGWAGSFEYKLMRFRGHGLVGNQGSFELSGYCFGRVPHNVRRCILYLPCPKKRNLLL